MSNLSTDQVVLVVQDSSADWPAPDSARTRPSRGPSADPEL